MKISICSDRPLITPCGLDRYNYQLDPYIGCEHYCNYCYVLGQAETDWGQEIQIYPDIGEQLEKELVGIASQKIFIVVMSTTIKGEKILAECYMTAFQRLLIRFNQQFFHKTIHTGFS